MSYHYTDLLLDNSDVVEGFAPGDQVAVLVHESVFEKCKRTLNYDGKSWDYVLRVNGKFFEMKLIYVTLESYEKLHFLRKLIKDSQFSLPWEEEPTIFCDVASMDVLDEFITLYELNPFIVKMEEKLGVTLLPEYIKTISFCKSKLHVIDAYCEFLAAHTSIHQQMLYINFAFPWLQPKALNHFKIPIEYEQMNLCLTIILDTLGSKPLHIFDLLNLKLALCDPLNPEPTDSVEYEIDCLIKRALNQMILKQSYIQQHHFDLHQYAFDCNFTPGDVFCLIPYFLYEFQNYIQTIEKLDNIVTEYISATIKLCDQNDLHYKLIKKSNTKFTIDGCGYNRMHVSLLADLLSYDNVVKIILDTNYPWVNALEIHNSNIVLNRMVEINLIGSNVFNFGDKLMTSIKTMLNITNADKYLDVIINGSPIISYLVFDNLIARQVIFRDIRISTAMLKDLAKSTLKIQYIRFDKCTFENKQENWRLLNELEQLQHAIIKEDDNTWQCIFDFITNSMDTSKADSFQFKRWVTILSAGKQINLQHIKFTIDEFKSKLQFREVRNDCQLIDLYDLKNLFRYDEKCDFEFYQ